MLFNFRRIAIIDDDDLCAIVAGQEGIQTGV
jgi:hypothetical protein